MSAAGARPCHPPRQPRRPESLSCDDVRNFLSVLLATFGQHANRGEIRFLYFLYTKPSIGANTRGMVFVLGPSAPIQPPANIRPCCATPSRKPYLKIIFWCDFGTRLMPESGLISSRSSIHNGVLSIML